MRNGDGSLYQLMEEVNAIFIQWKGRMKIKKRNEKK